jgi:hypothetical protein
MRPAPLKSRAYTFECLDCGRQTSVTAGTVMHRTKLPLTTWFRAAHLMSNHSNGMSALQLKGQMDVTYKTAWLLEQKLRRSMVDPDRTKLAGIVEVDQTEVPFRTKASFFDETTAKRIIIIGAVEIIDQATGVTPRKKRKGATYHNTRAGRIRLAVIPDNSSASIKAFVRANVEPESTLIRDGHRSYLNLTEYRHDAHVVTNIAAHIPLPWVHRVFALMKRWGLGTYHGLRRKLWIPISTSSYSASIADTIERRRSRLCSASPRMVARGPIGTSQARRMDASIVDRDASRRKDARPRWECDLIAYHDRNCLSSGG